MVIYFVSIDESQFNFNRLHSIKMHHTILRIHRNFVLIFVLAQKSSSSSSRRKRRKKTIRNTFDDVEAIVRAHQNLEPVESGQKKNTHHQIKPCTALFSQYEEANSMNCFTCFFSLLINHINQSKSDSCLINTILGKIHLMNRCVWF